MTWPQITIAIVLLISALNNICSLATHKLYTSTPGRTVLWVGLTLVWFVGIALVLSAGGFW